MLGHILKDMNEILITSPTKAGYCDCSCSCLSVCISLKNIENGLIDGNQILWKETVSHKNHPIEFWSSRVKGQGQSRGPNFWPNDREEMCHGLYSGKDST
jgi:hypothetical protein